MREVYLIAFLAGCSGAGQSQVGRTASITDGGSDAADEPGDDQAGLHARAPPQSDAGPPVTCYEYPTPLNPSTECVAGLNFPACMQMVGLGAYIVDTDAGCPDPMEWIVGCCDIPQPQASMYGSQECWYMYQYGPTYLAPADAVVAGDMAGCGVMGGTWSDFPSP